MLNLIQICKECGKEFEVFAKYRRQRHVMAQEYCPACNDRRQRRPAVIVERECLALIDGVRIESLPSEWEEFQATTRDYPSWRMIRRGDWYGDAWEGVLLIHATRKFVVGEACRLRHMRATRRVKRATWTRPTSGLSDAPAYVTHSYDFPPTTPDEAIFEVARQGGTLYASATAALAEGRFTVEEIGVENEYVVLEQPRMFPDDATHTLIWLEVESKYTLKGLGAQYKRSVDLSRADWHMEIRGGLRSGRRSTRGILAVVPDGEKIIVQSAGHGGGGDPEPYTWTAEYPMTAEPAALPQGGGSLFDLLD